jgi:hypothetical protein
MVIHRDEVIRFLNVKRPGMSLDAYQDEWFSVGKIRHIATIGYATIHRAIRLGELKMQEKEALHPFIHRDELNRFLRESPVRPKSERENIEPRIEITYTPIFVGVQSSFDARAGSLNSMFNFGQSSSGNLYLDPSTGESTQG